MPEIFGAALMGGGGKVFAVIDITYPAGATCTCSSGPKVLTAPDTTGHWLAVIPAAGEWTVSSNSSYGPVSETIDVQEKKAYFVVLGGNVYIYNNGSINTTFIGGITNEGYTVSVTTRPPTFGDTSFTLKGGSNYLQIAGTELSIDFSKFSTLHIKGSTSGGSGNAFSLNVTPTKNYTTGLVAQYVQPANNSSFDKSIDVSSVSGNYYLSINSTMGDNTATSEVSEIWLE